MSSVALIEQHSVATFCDASESVSGKYRTESSSAEGGACTPGTLLRWRRSGDTRAPSSYFAKHSAKIGHFATYNAGTA